MTRAEIREQALTQLSPSERIALAEDLWDSVRPGDLDVPDWHLEVVRERLDQDDDSPDDVIPGEEVLARLRAPRA